MEPAIFLKGPNKAQITFGCFFFESLLRVVMSPSITNGSLVRWLLNFNRTISFQARYLGQTAL
jgi:hypothetical protein